LKDRILPILLGSCFVILVTFALVLSQVIKPEIQQCIEDGDTEKAIALLKAEIEADPSYHMNYYVLGQLYYDCDQYALAKEQFEDALDKKSKHYESLYYLSRSLIMLGELDEAGEAIQEGLKKAKKLKAQFENGLGLLSMAREDYQEADRAFRRALAESDRVEADKLKDLRNAPISEEDRQLVIDSLRAEHASQNAEYHINLGDANFFQGVPSLAAVEYEKALQVDTGSLEVYYHWAEACLDMRDYNCAMEKLRVVLTKDSTHAQAWMRAGGIYFKAALSSRTRAEREERFKETIGSYKRYLELSQAQPDSSTVRPFFELAMAYTNIFGYEEAVAYFEQVLGIPYEPRDVYFYYGKALWGIRQFAKGAEMLLRHLDWIKEQPAEYSTAIQDAEVYQLLGDCYFYQQPKDFSKAIKYYKQSLESAPDQKRVLQNTAVAYHSVQSYVQAIEFYDRRIALGIDSASASIYKNAGYCALNIANAQRSDEGDLDMEEEEEELAGPDPDTNFYEVAIGYLDHYLEYSLNDDRVVLLVANTYLYQLADCANGVTYFERLLALDPSSCVAKKSLGYAYFGGVCEKNYTEALGYLTDAYTCVTDSGGPCADNDITKWIAQCYHLRAVETKGEAKADFKNAFDWYAKVLQCDPSDTEAKEAQDNIRYEY